MLPALLAMFLGCAGPAVLSDAGRKVQLMKGDPPQGCREIGAVDSDTSAEESSENFKIALRNNAGAKGANYVRMETVSPSGFLTGTSYQCPEAAK
jgi:hypothetical protein